MKKTILLLMGPSGCGKSTLEKQLLENDDVYRVVSTTTRQMRRGEVIGTTYHFIPMYAFNVSNMAGNFIQTTEFAGNFYGTTKDEYMTDHAITVLSLVPSSAVTFIPCLQEAFPDFDIKLVYFDISGDRLRNNMLERGDTEKEVDLRISHDDLAKQFTDAGLTPDLLLTDEDLTSNVGAFVRKTLDI